MRRLGTSLGSAEAEILVPGDLLVEGIQASEAYTNFPGYDLVATNAENVSCRVQVKSRRATDFDGGFPMKNSDCDSVVFVAPNRGHRYRRKKLKGDGGVRAPEVYVLPVDVVRNARRPENTWNKVFPKHLDGVENSVSRWDLIRSHLEFKR